MTYSAQSVMPPRNAILTKHRESLAEPLVSCRRFENPSEVLREGLRLIETRAPKKTLTPKPYAKPPMPALQMAKQPTFQPLKRARHLASVLRRSLTMQSQARQAQPVANDNEKRSWPVSFFYETGDVGIPLADPFGTS
jgi:Arc/MetJ-type ribon-helix-helix transcriptional regulator